MIVKRHFILDRSGSMYHILDDTIGGFNAFVESQKTNGGTMSLYLFDHSFEIAYNNIDIVNVEPLTKQTFIPRGNTALLDAIGNVINLNTQEDNLVIVIMTDGMENSSKIYTNIHIKDLINLHKKRGWEFMYLGANQDSILEASKLGIEAEQTLDFDMSNIKEVLCSVSAAITSRSMGTPTSLRKL